MRQPLNSTATIEEQACEWLALLRSPTLTQKQEKLFFSWLQEHPDHQKAFLYADQLWQRGAALQKIEEIAEVKGKTDFKAQRNNITAITSKARRLGNTWTGLGVAASIVVLASVVWLTQPDYVEQNEIFYTAQQEWREIQLSDGSTITLNANSRVRIDFDQSSVRQVHLQQGEVFFDVAHHPQKPFVINAGNSTVTVLGTQFSVEKDETETTIVVERGKVRVEPHATAEPLELTANQQSVVSEDGIQKSSVNAPKALAWREGLLRFENTSLADVTKELTRYYGARIELGDERIGRLQVVAVLSLKDGLTENLNYLTQSMGLVSVEDPVTNIIRILPTE